MSKLRFGKTTIYPNLHIWEGIPGGSVVRYLPAKAGDAGLILGSGRLPGEGHGNPFQYFCMGNPMDRGAWWATVRGVAKELDTTQRLNNNTAGKWQNSDGNPVLLKAKVFPAALHIKPLQRMATMTGKAKVSFPRGADVRLHKGTQVIQTSVYTAAPTWGWSLPLWESEACLAGVGMGLLRNTTRTNMWTSVHGVHRKALNHFPCSLQEYTDMPFIKTISARNSLAVQWLGLWAFITDGLGLIPGQGTKIPQVTQSGQK